MSLQIGPYLHEPRAEPLRPAHGSADFSSDVPDRVQMLIRYVLHCFHNYIEVCWRGSRTPGIYDHHFAGVGVDPADYYGVGTRTHVDADRPIKREIHHI